MTEETFERIYAGLKELSPVPGVYFGGVGEPLFHPKTVEWIRRIKGLGARVEMITNGTILTEKKSRELIDAGLDVLWVSLDGATPDSFADIRMGAELPMIIDNLKRLFKLRKGGHFPQPEIGVAFVAMKRNIDDLPKLIKLGHTFGAKILFRKQCPAALRGVAGGPPGTVAARLTHDWSGFTGYRAFIH